MKIKVLLATATAAVSLLTSVAMADNNSAFIKQDKDRNVASVDQNSGKNNVAGVANLELRQYGSLNTSANMFNSLTITQSGNGNSVGASNGGLIQTLTYGVGATNYKAHNNASITQSSNNNVVGSVSQRTATHGGDNSLSITQQTGSANTILDVVQSRSQTTANTATIVQSGEGNKIALISQKTTVYDGAFNTVNAKSNVISATFTGSTNGTLALSGAAAASGATTSSLIQGKTVGADATQGNQIALVVSGSNNEFGVTQTSNGAGSYRNTVGALRISGDRNQVGIYQAGSDNVVGLADVSGLENIIGIRQVGTSNSATVNVRGNNNGGYSNFGAGFAGSLATSAGLTAGLIGQEGIGNDTTLTVTGNSNIFAIRQGDSAASHDNIVTAVQTGDLNQVAIVQLGSNNLSNLVQSGSTNTASISQ